MHHYWRLLTGLYLPHSHWQIRILCVCPAGHFYYTAALVSSTDGSSSLLFLGPTTAAGSKWSLISGRSVLTPIYNYFGKAVSSSETFVTSFRIDMWGRAWTISKTSRTFQFFIEFGICASRWFWWCWLWPIQILLHLVLWQQTLQRWILVLFCMCAVGQWLLLSTSESVCNVVARSHSAF